MKKAVTFYKIQVRCDDKAWDVEHRYSEFDDLLTALKKVFADLPRLPPKTAFKLKSPEGILKRRQGLDAFLKALAVRQEILNHALLISFLQVRRNTLIYMQMEGNNPGVVPPAPTKMAELGDLPMGVRDFLYVEEEGLMFVALSDMSIVSRVDAYFNNLKLLWKKDKESEAIVGAVVAYRVGKEADESVKFERLWAKTYGFQTNVLAWSGPFHLLAIGMDDGKVHGIRSTPEAGYKTFEDVRDSAYRVGFLAAVAQGKGDGRGAGRDKQPDVHHRKGQEAANNRSQVPEAPHRRCRWQSSAHLSGVRQRDKPSVRPQRRGRALHLLHR